LIISHDIVFFTDLGTLASSFVQVLPIGTLFLVPEDSVGLLGTAVGHGFDPEFALSGSLVLEDCVG
jgi:hypothetical protein